MDGIKCNNCHLINLGTDFSCPRCGQDIGFADSLHGQRLEGTSTVRSLLYTLLALTLIGSAIYYVFSGFEKSYTKIEATEANRMAQQPQIQPLDQTRSQFENQQAGHYGTAIQNSNGLAQSQKHTKEIEKLMEPPK